MTLGQPVLNGHHCCHWAVYTKAWCIMILYITNMAAVTTGQLWTSLNMFPGRKWCSCRVILRNTYKSWWGFMFNFAKHRPEFINMTAGARLSLMAMDAFLCFLPVDYRHSGEHIHLACTPANTVSSAFWVRAKSHAYVLGLLVLCLLLTSLRIFPWFYTLQVASPRSLGCHPILFMEPFAKQFIYSACLIAHYED